jgi:uncharacterized protein (UPF0276 family)
VHYAHVFEHRPAVDWFEIISENFMVDGGRPIENLDRALASYPIVQHGVSLSIGSTAPLDWEYLARLKELTRKTKTPWVSDHLCWTGVHGRNLHDLLPMPYTEEALRHVAERARVVQDYLETRLVLENASSYLTYTESDLSEWDFLTAIAEEADLGILFDVNNVYVSSQNHGFDPVAYVDAVPAHRIVQIHLAGHTRFPKYILDTHTGEVASPVWDLYRRTLARTGPVSTMVEWDDEIPPFDVVWAEVQKARTVATEVFAETDGAGADAPRAREPSDERERAPRPDAAREARP